MKRWPALEIRFSAPEHQDLVQAALMDFDPAAIDEGSPDDALPVWRVFFHTLHTRDAAAASLPTAFPSEIIAADPVDVPDDDWAARSQAALHAVTVGNIVVAPPWDVPDSAGLKSKTRPTYTGEATIDVRRPGLALQTRQPTVIVIQPSMGFGTGHHATTRLCLAALQQIHLIGRRVLDVGTGSGVLAIAASRLGATQVLAIDNDPDAITSARENLSLNPATNVTLGTLDIRSTMLRPFDVVLGNLTGGLLIAVGARLQALSGRWLVLSGFLASEEDEVLAAFPGWTTDRRSQEDEWACVTLSKQRVG